MNDVDMPANKSLNIFNTEVKDDSGSARKSFEDSLDAFCEEVDVEALLNSASAQSS